MARSQRSQPLRGDPRNHCQQWNAILGRCRAPEDVHPRPQLEQQGDGSRESGGFSLYRREKVKESEREREREREKDQHQADSLVGGGSIYKHVGSGGAGEWG